MMADRLDARNANRRGLSSLVLFNIKTGKSALIGVGYRRARGDKGLMLNFCPWCGAKILWDKKPAYRKELTT